MKSADIIKRCYSIFKLLKLQKVQVRGFQKLVMEKNIFSKYVLHNAQKSRFVR